MKDVIFANLSAIAYCDMNDYEPGDKLSDIITDKSMYKPTDRFLFVNYKENEKYIWKDLLMSDDWRFLRSADWRDMYSKYNKDVAHENGFYAIAVESTNDIVVAFRGTDDLFDGFNDVQLLMNGVARQLPIAYKFISSIISNNLDNKKIHITGHSLGGSLVEAIMSTNLADKITSACTFNSFGIKELLVDINESRLSQIDFNTSVGWLGINNIGTVTKELLNVYKNARKQNKDEYTSILGQTLSIDYINTLLTHAEIGIAHSPNGFNSILEKDSRLFNNLKYQFGTVNTSGDVRDRININTDRVGNANFNFEVDKEVIGVNSEIVYDFMKFILDVNIKSKNIDKITNYVISKDLVGIYRDHYGKTVVVDDSEIEIVNTGFKIDKFILAVHSIGNFALFMSDAGILSGKLRYSYVINVVRDFVKSNSTYVKVIGDINSPRVNKNLVDLIIGAPVATLTDKAFMKKLVFEWVLKKVLPFVVLKVEHDQIVIGVKTNILTLDTDGSDDILAIKILN